MKTRRTKLFCIVTCAVMLLMTRTICARPMGHYGYWKMVEDIAREASTPEKKDQVAARLLGIVQDTTAHIYLRKAAVEKLGDLGSPAAKDMLKNLSENLPWTDSTRPLKRAAFLAYWRISVAEQSKHEDQVAILMKALHAKLGTIIASNVQIWAADELANRGIKEALPEIIKSVRYRNPTERGEEQIRLCTTKIELITTSANREEALTRALAMKDFTQEQELRKWAIQELGKLGTQDSQSVLVGFALDLQNRYYDKDGKRVHQDEDRLDVYAPLLYNTIVDLLRDSGLSDTQIKGTGVQHDKFFILAP